MGKFVYVPDVISIEELEENLLEIKELCLKVDRSDARGMLHEAISELANELDNIEKGHRDPLS